MKQVILLSLTLAVSLALSRGTNTVQAQDATKKTGTETQTNGEFFMTENDSAQTSQQSPKPSPDLKSLDRLAGAWKVSGEAQGQIRYEWTEGGFFLVQHFDLERGGRKIKGVEVIGHLQRLGEEPGKEIR